ncbi:Eukaryotic translation initiation factor 5A-1 [Mactra antiquata]
MKKNFRAAKNFSNRQEVENTPLSMDSCMDDMETADAEASLTTPVKTSALRKNEFVVLQGHPCKIIDLATSRPGKHGHAKVHIFGRDVVTGKKYEDISPSSHVMNVPVIKQKEYIVVDMGDSGFLSLIDNSGYLRADLRVTDDVMKKTIANKIDKPGNENIIVTVMTILGIEIVMSVKTGVK